MPLLKVRSVRARWWVALGLGTIAYVTGLPAAAQQPAHAHVVYLPEAFRNVYFGMPLERFREVRPEAQERSPSAIDFRVELEERPDNATIEMVTYYFDREGDLPLYELIIEYRSVNDRDRAAERLFGDLSLGTREIDTGEGFTIRAWSFQSKLVIVAVLPGTEYDER